MNDTTENAQLNTCGCCKTDQSEPAHENRAGLSSLTYRIGTHGTFLSRMLARLARQEIPEGDNQGRRPLAALTTRSEADPAIALLDGWAILADVLAFYQERIANEGFLRTATERRSVLELARAIGYELNPGVAASTYLSFTVDDSPGAPDTAAVPMGTQVLSIPAKEGERPQTFETMAAFEAQAAWNALKPRTTKPDDIAAGTTEIYLKGTATGLQPGDAVLLVGDERERWHGSERWDFRILQTVESFPKAGYTRIAWQPGLGHEGPTVEPADNPSVFAFRQRAALFGHNAPDWRTMPDNIKSFYDPDWNPDNPDRRKTQWPNFEIQTVEEDLIDLDAAYPKILSGSWIVLEKSDYVELYKAVETTPYSRTDYTLTAQVARLKLDTREHLRWFGLRDTVVFAQSEKLDLAEKPLSDPVEGNAIEMDGHVTGLEKGQPIIVTGKRSEEDADTFSEVAFVEAAEEVGTRTVIVLQSDLENSYVRSTVTLYANVVPATHGETVAGEALGGGDGAQAYQQFNLKQSPLTYVSAETATGNASTLQVTVNGVLWEQVPSLYSRSPSAENYTVRIDDDATATVIFGDGKSGARLPTGQENIEATYRFGIGRAGEVGAGALSLLKKRPFGVRSVTNPVPAGGAADPEKLEDARQNAPLTVLTLDRIVSLQDFEDFARAFAGIGKAQAIRLWAGESAFVHITVADDDGDPVPVDVRQKLGRAIDNARDPSADVQIDNYELLTFNVEAGVLFDPAYLAEDVQAEIEQTLLEAFSFARRAFGQPVTAAELLSVIHRVAGVVAVDLDALYIQGESASPAQVLPALTARPENGQTLPAQLLLLTGAGIKITMTTT